MKIEVEFTVPKKKYRKISDLRDFGTFEVCMNECESLQSACEELDQELVPGKVYKLVVNEVKGGQIRRIFEKAQSRPNPPDGKRQDAVG